MRQGPWLGGFDAGEAILSRELSFAPLGTVVGNAFYVPILVGYPANSAEVSSISRLATEAWGVAAARLRRAAEALQADGVVGIRLSKREVPSAGVVAVEFSMIGTAVRGLRQPSLWTTDASIADVAMMTRAGYAPLSLVVGCCTWHESSWNFRPTYRKGLLGLPFWINEEVPFAVRAMSTARNVAMERMQDAARQSGATGVIGVRLQATRAARTDDGGAVAGFEAFGTAVATYGSDCLDGIVATVPMSR